MSHRVEQMLSLFVFFSLDAFFGTEEVKVSHL